jgi:hypothetical protein
VFTWWWFLELLDPAEVSWADTKQAFFHSFQLLLQFSRAGRIDVKLRALWRWHLSRPAA